MLKKQERQELQGRLQEVASSIEMLENSYPNHPALYHLRSERKWMEQRLKKTFWYRMRWKISALQGVFLMSTVGLRIWFITKVRHNTLNRVVFFLTMIVLLTGLILFQGRVLFGWDLFPNSDSPIDEWILGN